MDFLQELHAEGVCAAKVGQTQAHATKSSIARKRTPNKGGVMPWYLWLILSAGLLLIGAGMYWVNDREIRFELTTAIGAALCTSVIVSFAVFKLQSDIDHARAEADWRERIQSTDPLKHFSPGDHSMRGIDLSGKEIVRSNFTEANLRGIHMRAAKVRDTKFEKARLDGSDLVAVTFDGNTSFNQADLSGADLRDAKFIKVDVSLAKSLRGAKVNSGTCWPKGFMRNNDEILKHLQAIPKMVEGEKRIEKGREFGSCLAGIGGP